MQTDSLIISSLASFFRVKLVPRVFQELRVRMAKMAHPENLVRMESQAPQEKGYVFHGRLKGKCYHHPHGTLPPG